MWEGPSWQSDRPEVSFGESPPTKWPRVTTPPNRRTSILTYQGLNDSGLGDSFCSPPLAQKRNMRISPLRTPGSTKSNSTPFSPFGRFRLSSFSSPTLSNRALHLSNNENILDYTFCEDTLEKNRGRCLLPELPKENNELEDIKPPGFLDMLETPSKGFNIEDSGFEDSFNLFGSSPLKQLFLGHYEEVQAGTSLDNIEDTSSSAVETEPVAKIPRTEESSTATAQSKSDNIFAQPNRPLRRISVPFSRRWLRYTTGGTRSQREVTSQARTFLARRFSQRRMVNAVEELVKRLGDVYLKEEIDSLVTPFSSSGSVDLNPEEFERMEQKLLQPLDSLNIALVVVDFQNDFIDGSLGIKDPMEAIPLINRLTANQHFKMVVYTQDWHPNNHISFYEHARNEDRELSPDDKARKLRPFDIVRFERPPTIQILYPSHCVQSTWGSQIHSDIKIVEGAKMLKKGGQVFMDSYSAFADNGGFKRSELEALLRSAGINTVIAGGLAFDICVFSTLKDASNLGFFCAVIRDASKGLVDEKIKDAEELFRKRNIANLTTDEAIRVAEKRFLPIEWARILVNRAQK